MLLSHLESNQHIDVHESEGVVGGEKRTNAENEFSRQIS